MIETHRLVSGLWTCKLIVRCVALCVLGVICISADAQQQRLAENANPDERTARLQGQLSDVNWAQDISRSAPEMTVVQSSESGITVEVRAEWDTNLADDVRHHGFSADGLAMAAVRGFASLSHSQTLPVLAMPEVQVISADYDEVPLRRSQQFGDTTVLETPVERFAYEPAAVTVLGMERREPTATLTARLLVVDAQSQTVRRYKRMLISMRYTHAPLNTAKGGGANPHLNVQNSVLSTGTWFKIPILEEGVYRINSSYLQQLGIDIGTLNPDNLQLFSNGGRPVPALTSAPRPADLVETPIMVTGAGDGAFNEGDTILFYAQGPSGWDWIPDSDIEDETDDSHWSHYLNPFSREAYVFLRVDGEQGARTGGGSFPAWTDAVRQNRTEARVFAEEDLVNLIRNGGGSGLEWLGAEASASRPTITVLDTIPAGLGSGDIRYRMRAAARANPRVTLSFFQNGQEIGSVRPAPVAYSSADAPLGFAETLSVEQPVPGNGRLNVTMTMDGTLNNPLGWIDWVEAVYPRTVQASNGLIRFFTPGGESGRFEYALGGFSSEPIVWDVSDPANVRRLGTRFQDGRYLVQIEVGDTNNPVEFVAFELSSSRINAPLAGFSVENQNLHAVSGYPEYILVTPAEFRSQAEDLAAYRRTADGLQTVVVDINQIYNEFSGGMVDMRAVRDYVKFLYDRAPTDAELPRYLLLFGDGHYDYRGLTQAGQSNNWIPTYQTPSMLAVIQSYTSDDYYGLMDDVEGVWAEPDHASSTGVYTDPGCQTTGCPFLSERVDVGVGRLPAQSVSDAEAMVNKILHYESQETLGSWRQRYTFIADDENPNPFDNDLHVQNADVVAELIDDMYSDVNLHKIYSTSYPNVITAAGRRIPEASAEIRRILDEGTLVWNYSGHGGHYALADERLITLDDIQELDNFDRLSIFITATCSFGRFDMTDQESGAEALLLNPNGGGVALFTTVRLVYTSASTTALNLGLNLQLASFMMEREPSGSPRRLGDILRLTKGTDVGAQANNRKFNLLGDPAMQIGLPTRDVSITSINGSPIEGDLGVGSTMSTTSGTGMPEIRANELTTIEGQVLDSFGQPDVSFNGEVEVQVFDAERLIELDPDVVSFTDGTYSVRNDRIYRGRATVTGGQFTTQFIVPRDVSYSGMSGRVSAYVVSSQGADGGGSTESFLISESAGDPLNDTQGPRIEAYLNDSTFVPGGLVGSDPTLLVRLFDENGINTVGAGVGHELLVTFDNDSNTAVEVGRFYEGDLDTYQRGTVRFPLPGQEPGEHTLTFTAWDVANNSSTVELAYVVSSSEDLELRNVYNYPNPTTGNTQFIFEHNYAPGALANIQVRIFTLSGRPVRTLESEEVLTGGVVRIPFDGFDEDVDPLGTGIYLYRVRLSVEDPDGGNQVAERIERLAVIR